MNFFKGFADTSSASYQRHLSDCLSRAASLNTTSCSYKQFCTFFCHFFFSFQSRIARFASTMVGWNEQARRDWTGFVSGAAAGAAANSSGSHSSRFTLFKSRSSTFKVSPSRENFTVFNTGVPVLKEHSAIFSHPCRHADHQVVLGGVNLALRTLFMSQTQSSPRIRPPGDPHPSSSLQQNLWF